MPPANALRSTLDDAGVAIGAAPLRTALLTPRIQLGPHSAQCTRRRRAPPQARAHAASDSARRKSPELHYPRSAPPIPSTTLDSDYQLVPRARQPSPEHLTLRAENALSKSLQNCRFRYAEAAEVSTQRRSRRHVGTMRPNRRPGSAGRCVIFRGLLELLAGALGAGGMKAISAGPRCSTRVRTERARVEVSV